MVSFVQVGGHLSTLDYNHTKIQWDPLPPTSMLSFYQAFLFWRSDAGMDNLVADNLLGIFKNQGLKHIQVLDL